MRPYDLWNPDLKNEEKLFPCPITSLLSVMTQVPSWQTPHFSLAACAENDKEKHS